MAAAFHASLQPAAGAGVGGGAVGGALHSAVQALTRGPYLGRGVGRVGRAGGCASLARLGSRRLEEHAQPSQRSGPVGGWGWGWGAFDAHSPRTGSTMRDSTDSIASGNIKYVAF